MSILILSPRYTSDSNTLWQAALKAGWQIERLHSYTVPDHIQNQSVTIYGEGLFVTRIASLLNYALYEAPLNWLTTVPTDFLKRQVQFLSLTEARQINHSIFVKPAEFKTFDAKVYPSGAELPNTETYSPEMPVIVAEPVQWHLEYRCFVLNRQVKTLSPYSQNGSYIEVSGEMFPAETTAAHQFAEMVLKNMPVPPAFVLDIGQIEGRGWAVIEANPVWASGIYQCDPAKVLEVLAASMLPTSQLTAENRQWVIERLA